MGLGLYTSLDERRQEAEAARRDTVQAVRLIAAQEAQQIGEIQQVLRVLALSGVFHEADCSSLVADLLTQSRYYANVGAVALDGDIYCSALPLNGRVNAADRTWFKNVVQTQRFSAGNFQIGRVTGKPTQNFGFPIFDRSGTLQGVAFVAMDLGWFARVAADTQLPQGADFVIVDEDGTILARYPNSAHWVGRPMPDGPIVQAFRRTYSVGTVEGTGPDGVRRVYAFAPLSGAPQIRHAYMAVGIPVATAFALADSTLAETLGALALVVLLAFVASRVAADRFIFRGVDTLLAATARLSAGDLTARTGLPHGHGELGALAGAFDEMAASLQLRATQTATAEEARRHSERRFRALIENSSDGIVLLDNERTIVYASPSVKRMLGYEPEEIVGQKVFAFQHPDDRPRTAETHARLLAEPARAAAGVVRIRHRNGSWRWVDAVSTNQLADPSVRAIVSNFRDVTERRRAEEALAQNEHRFRALIEHSSDVTVLTQADGTVTYASPSIQRVLGYSAEEMVGQTTFALLHPDDTARMGEVFRKLVQEPGGQVAAEFRARHKNGSWRWMDAVGTNLLADPDVKAIVGHFWDINKRKDAEEGLHRRAADLEALHDIAQALREARSLDDMYDTLVNRSMALFGAVHGSLALLSADRATFTRVCTKGIATEATGSTFPVAGSRSGKVVESQVSFVTGDFATVVQPRPWMEPEAYHGLGPFVLVPVRSEEDIVGTLVVARSRGPESAPFTQADVRLLETIAETAGTAIRRARLYADLQRHAAELEQRVAERTAALREAKDEADRANRAKSEFLSRMSHELRTPLNAVLGFAQLLEMDSLNPDQRESVDYILKGGRHLLNLINEVLDIARIEAGRLTISAEPVRVHDVIRETLDLMRPLAAETRVTLAGDAAGTAPWYVLADSQRLKQVLLNLVSNGIKYGGQGGTVTLSCTEIPGNRLRVAIRDTGPGIPPDQIARLFRPFERLGGEQTGVEGTGLGLALSKGLTEAMGGTLGVESTVGKGSTFWVEFPAAESPLARLQTDSQKPGAGAFASAPPQTSAVLYIEDNLSNFELIQRLLGQRPHVKLLAAMQGGLGLELARRHKPDLILLDLHLPDIAGDEVLRRLREAPETRGIPVVMISADATPAQIDRLVKAGAHTYLTKPLDVKQFFAVVDQLLKAPEVRRAPG